MDSLGQVDGVIPSYQIGLGGGRLGSHDVYKCVFLYDEVNGREQRDVSKLLFVIDTKNQRKVVAKRHGSEFPNGRNED